MIKNVAVIILSIIALILCINFECFLVFMFGEYITNVLVLSSSLLFILFSIYFKFFNWYVLIVAILGGTWYWFVVGIVFVLFFIDNLFNLNIYNWFMED